MSKRILVSLWTAFLMVAANSAFARVTGLPDKGHARAERHVCVDTTASGGNAALLGGHM